MGDNKLNNKAKRDWDFSSATNFRLWHFKCFIPFFFKYKRSDKQGEFFKERQGMRAIEGSSVLVVEVLKALYKRCVASF